MPWSVWGGKADVLGAFRVESGDRVTLGMTAKFACRRISAQNAWHSKKLSPAFLDRSDGCPFGCAILVRVRGLGLICSKVTGPSQFFLDTGYRMEERSLVPQPRAGTLPAPAYGFPGGRKQ